MNKYIDKGTLYKNELREIAQKLEEFRLKIYKEIDSCEEDKTYIDNELFKIQSNLRYEKADLIENLIYKK